MTEPKYIVVQTRIDKCADGFSEPCFIIVDEERHKTLAQARKAKKEAIWSKDCIIIQIFE